MKIRENKLIPIMINQKSFSIKMRKLCGKPSIHSTMNFLTSVVVLISAFCCFRAVSGTTIRDEDTLVLVHALFRHGNRAPTSIPYKDNPISDESYYMPYGLGQLTNEGKKTEYRIGTSLRERYNSFLGNTYNINLMDARTTNVNRTKMSLQLMLAGLWPPKGDQIWKNWFNWQPIPYNYLTNDKELFGVFVCKNYNTLYNEVENSAEIQKKLSKYQDIYEYVFKHTRQNFSTPTGIIGLYVDSYAQKDFGYALESWLEPKMPDLEKIAKDFYYIGTNTTALKKIAGGFLLRKIINDSKAKIDDALVPEQRKMFLYSAHEMNVAKFLLTLGVFEDKIPAYGAHVLVELHRLNGIFGFKIFYQDWTTDEPKLLTVPGCSAFCPFDDFVQLFAEVIPTDADCTMA